MSDLILPGIVMLATLIWMIGMFPEPQDDGQDWPDGGGA